MAALIGAKPSEIVFTSGGTEADNLAVFGAVAASPSPRKHVITTSIEHHAVLHSCEELVRRGIEVTVVPVSQRRGSEGVVDPEEIRRVLRPETVLISVMHANNEMGTIQPIEEIGADRCGSGRTGFTAMRFSRQGKFPWMCRRLARTCFRFRRISFAGRREWARFMFDPARHWLRDFMAGMPSATGVLERRTCRGLSASVRRRNWRGNF